MTQSERSTYIAEDTQKDGKKRARGTSVKQSKDAAFSMIIRNICQCPCCEFIGRKIIVVMARM